MSNSQKTKLQKTFNASEESTEKFGKACRKTATDTRLLEK
jgi:hypothetical protein